MKRELSVIEDEYNGILVRILLDELKKYNPNQPRVPSGNANGGQWTSGGGGRVSGPKKPRPISKIKPLVNELELSPKIGGNTNFADSENSYDVTRGGSRSGSQEASKTPKNWASSKPDNLKKHYDGHGKQFNAKSEKDYIKKSQDFFKRSQKEKVPTLKYYDGRIGVYEPKTNTFGLYTKDGKTITYFKPTSHTYFQRQIEKATPKGGKVRNSLPNAFGRGMIPSGGVGGGPISPARMPNYNDLMF